METNPNMNQMGTSGQSGNQTPNPAGAPAVGKNIAMGVLAYLGPLVIVSFIVAKDDPFVKYHIKQGLVLFVIEVVLWMLSNMIWQLWMIYDIINIGTLILSILGIVNVVNGQEKELPLVGKFASYFKF